MAFRRSVELRELFRAINFKEFYMKNIFGFILLLLSLTLAGNAMADDTNGQLTPDGYLGHTAFEFGINGNAQSNSFTENYTYTNYLNQETLKGTGSYNFNNVFLNVYYPVSSTFTLMAGGSFLINATNTSSFSATANTFNGTENSTTAFNYPSGYSWFVSCRIYTK
jgi:hypothetical protein